MKEKNLVKVVVTGGAGFIGSNLTDALVKAGYDVHVIDNLVGGKREQVNPHATFHQKDIRRLAEIEPIFAGASCVFHLAALPRVQYSIENPAETHEANVTGTQNVLIAATNAMKNAMKNGMKTIGKSGKTSGHKVRVIYSASSSMYGDQPTMPLVETMPANPKSPYGLHKYVGELYCRVWSEVYDLETVCLRYFNVYGPRQSSEGAYALVIAKFLKQVAQGKPMTLTGDGDQTRDFTHVRDVVNANLLAMASAKVGRGEAINIGAGDNHTINHIAELIGGEMEYVPARFEPKNTLADNSLARRLLGWKPQVSLKEGIAELKKLASIKNKAQD